MAKFIFIGFVNCWRQNMQINSYSNYNNYSCGRKEFSFKGCQPLEIKGFDTSLTLKSLNLIKKVNDLVDKTWIEIRKSGNRMDFPKFHAADLKGNFVTLKPVYNGLEKKLLFEIENEKYIDRIFINRATPKDYRYERSVITDYGSATTKSFNALKEKDSAIEARVNGYIEKYFPKVLPAKDENLTKKALGLA